MAIDAPPYSLADWLAQLQAEPAWRLPARVQLQAQRPQLTARQGACAAALLLVGGLELWWRQSALVWVLGLMGVSAWVWLHAQRQPLAVLQRPASLAFKGCHVDVPARRVRSEGLAHAVEVQLHPAQDWSVGVYGVITQRVAQYFIELRHVRRGPVVVLCELVSHTPLSAQDAASIDAAVAVMAERLGLRRSGRPLVAPPSSPRAAAAQPQP